MTLVYVGPAIGLNASSQNITQLVISSDADIQLLLSPKRAQPVPTFILALQRVGYGNSKTLARTQSAVSFAEAFRYW
jgi:hypothetical protein